MSSFGPTLLTTAVEPMDFFSSLDAELSARSAYLPNVGSLDFINDPAKSGPYQCQTPELLKQPNIGLYTLKPTTKNHIFLEHESRLCDILSTLELMEATKARDNLEDQVVQELIRINRLKEIEWSDNTSESHFVDKHPKNTTLLAIYVTTLVIHFAGRYEEYPEEPVVACPVGQSSPKGPKEAPYTVQDIENIDKRSWPERDVGKHLRLARQWRDAQTIEEQEILFRNHGIRWSPLLDLPYWNPILFTTIEPMHVFDAGLFQTHCRQVWGIDTTAPGGDGLTLHSTKTIATPSASEIEMWYEVIRTLKDSEELREQLKGCARDTLWHICSNRDLRRAGNKLQLIAAIVEWCQTVSPDEILLPVARSIETIPRAVSASTPQTGLSDAESRSIHEGSVTTDDSVASIRNLDEERIPSEEEQKAVDKCIKQLNDRASPNTVLQAKKIVLRFICRDYCFMAPKELDKLCTKDELYEAAANWVEEHSPPPENSAQGGKARSTTGAILGKDIMEAIWADMARTQLPSWVTDVPHNWGTAARGKLSANNWRVICTVHLPITLIRLWGGDDAPEDWKHKLQNFMDLVCAVQIANVRLISKKDIELYKYYIQRYLTDFKTLYKSAKVKPIHHAALHYGDTLRGFGPAHTHGAAFYERYIHSMQRKNHNMKLGELELTFMRSSAREAKLQALLFDHSEVHEHVGELAKTYEAFLNEDSRGTRLAHMVDMAHLTQQPDFVFDETCLCDANLPDAILPLLVQFLNQRHRTTIYSTDSCHGISVLPRAKFLDKFSLRGVQYSTASRQMRNSRVFFRPPKLDPSESLAHPEPGQIIHVFLHSQINISSAQDDKGQLANPSIYLCIQPYLPLQSELSDIDEFYRRFGFAGGFLSAQELGPPIIVDQSSIISHVAVTPLEIMGCKALHVLPMDRLMQMSITSAEDDEVDSAGI
ncbi:hypothetical protein EDB87DRAFT_1582376 [Lactarius vividus]|nr:hypothetical protein EDB87DRAFT_1582376 [Lactarius vividus]